MLPSDRGRSNSNVHDDYTIFDMENQKISKEVLYADKIGKDEYDQLLASAKSDIKAKKEAVDAALDVIKADLAATNSERYFSGAEAQNKIEKLNAIKTDLADLLTSIESLTEEEINDKIDEYNNALPELKKGAELTLLKAQADRINNTKKEVETSDREVTYGSDYYPYTYESSEKDMYKIKHTFTFKEMGDFGMAKYTEHISKYEYINYWGWIKNGPWDGWPWNILDDDINKLKGKIRGLGYELDYDESEIVHV